MTQREMALVVGKFAPLHRGHEALIAHAHALAGSVLLLSYAVPEPADAPAALRERWLQARCPRARIVVLDDARLRAACRARGLPVRPMPPDDAPGPTHWAWLAWCLRELLAAEVDLMVGSEAYVPPCAAHLSQALGRPVEPVLYDPGRTRAPVSASAIRANPDGLRHWLSPEVAATWPARADP